MSVKIKFIYIFTLYLIFLFLFFLVFYTITPVEKVPAQLNCPYDAKRLKFVGEWSSNRIVVTSNNDKYLSKLIFFQANKNNNQVAINKSISLANKNLDIIGALALTGNLCVNGVCRSGLNEVRGLIGEGVTGSIAFWVAIDEIRGDFNFIWQTSTRSLIISNLVTSTQLKGALKADYVKSGTFLNNFFTFPRNLNIGNNLYVTNAILAKATITTNRAFCLSANCLSFWPWLLENFVRGRGIANYLAKWVSNNTIDKSIIYENNNKLGINTTSLISTVNIYGSLKLRCLFFPTTTCLILPTTTQSGFVLTSASSGNAYWSRYRVIPQNTFILSLYPDLNSRYPNWKYANAYVLLKSKGAWFIPSSNNFKEPDDIYDNVAPIQLTQKRSNATGVLYNYATSNINIKRIYIFGGNGGVSSGNDALDTLEYLDLNSSTHQFVSSTTVLPSPITDASAVFNPNNGDVYIIGGRDHDKDDRGNHILNSVIICKLNLQNQQLTCNEDTNVIKPMNYRRRSHKAILYNNKIIVIGGKGRLANEPDANNKILNTIEYLDLTSASSQRIWKIASATLTVPRINFDIVLWQDPSTGKDVVYVIGGNDEDNKCYKDIEKITLSTGTNPISSVERLNDFIYYVSYHSLEIFQKRIFLIGGLVNSQIGCHNANFRSDRAYYTESISSWSLLPARLKYNVSKHVSISLFQDKPYIFAIGGIAPGGITSSIQIYDPSYPAFILNSDYDLLYDNRSQGAASVIVDDKIFYIGGNRLSNSFNKVAILYLNTTSLKWVNSQPINKERTYAQAVVAQGYGLGNNTTKYIYLIGGHTGNAANVDNSLKSVEILDLEQFKSNTNTPWREVATAFQLPEERTHHGAIVVKNKIFVVGGFTPRGTGYEVTTSIIMLNPTSSLIEGNKWKYVGKLPNPRARFAIAPFHNDDNNGDGFYIIGGVTDDINSVYKDYTNKRDEIVRCTIKNIDTLDPSVDCKGALNMYYQRMDARANLLNNEIIIIGGRNRGTFDSIEKFDWRNVTSSNTASSVKTIYLPSVLNLARHSHISHVYRNKIFVIGGHSGSNLLTETEIFDNPIYYLYYYIYGSQ